MPDHYLLIIVVAIGFCLTAYYKKWLSRSGAIAACLLAIIILFSGGWKLAVPMVVFFISSSMLSKLPSRSILRDSKQKKPRDYMQVICNGAIAGIICLFNIPIKNPVIIILYFISIAISINDTWSSETGNYFKGKVFDIISFRRIEKGLSGGISFKGSIIGFLGSLLIGLLYYFLYEKNLKSSFIITISGFTGMLADSIIGSLFQAKYLDEKGKITEMKLTGKAKTVKGCQWITNDLVNLLSNAIITFLACGILMLFN